MRFVIVMAASFLLGSTFVVGVNYWMAWRSKRFQGIRLLPLHVAAVALSYDLMLFLTTAYQLQRLADHEPITWRFWIYVASVTLGYIAMYAIFMLEKKRDRTDNLT